MRLRHAAFLTLFLAPLLVAPPAGANHGTHATYEGGCFRFSGTHFALDLLTQQWSFVLTDLCEARTVRGCTAYGSIEGGFAGTCSGRAEAFSTCGTGHWHLHGSGADAHAGVCMTWNGVVVLSGEMSSTD